MADIEGVETLDDGTGNFSLADLADLDVSDIEEIRFVSLYSGVYDFVVDTAELKEDTRDDKRVFIAEFGLKIAEVHAILEPNITAEQREKMVDKVHTQKFIIRPTESQEDVLKQIGRVRAFITDIGQDSAGKLGDIVRNAKGHAFKATITKSKDRQDPTREFTNLKLDPKK